MAYNGLKDENIVALCDVDSNRLYEHAEKYPHIATGENLFVTFA